MDSGRPQPSLSLLDTVALTVGVVVGAGIFKTPALVAANAGGESGVLLLWLAGGLVTLIGALCYAELVSAYPHPGGEYHYLRRAYGGSVAFLFAWTRLMVMQTGSIALLAFVFADYANVLWPIPGGGAIYAAAAIVVFTALNVLGVYGSSRTQRTLCVVTVLGMIGVAVAGLLLPAREVAATAAASDSGGALGMALIFVLLTYGGWNEAAYVSAEVRDGARNMVRALLWSTALITGLYLLLNVALLRALGLEGLAGSEAPAAAMMRQVAGSAGSQFVSLLIALVALASLNVTILTGARSNWALARDYRLFGFLGRWNERAGAPRAALLAQAVIALGLVALGALSSRAGFETMVDYVSPVFWLFFLLTGVSILVLRHHEPSRRRPFRVPLYPWTPLLFCLTCAYLLYSSLAYTGVGALLGVGVLAAGVPLLAIAHRLGSD